jgi:MFS family permease
MSSTKGTNRRWYRWLVYSVANAAFLVGVSLSAIGIAIPEIMRDFSIQADQMGQIISAYSYTYALMQIPGGLLADRIGPRYTMTTFLLIGGVGIVLFSQAGSFGMGLAGRVLTAVGVGVLYVNQIKVLRGWFAPNEFATAMGIGSSINNIGGLVARPLLAYLVENLSWQTAYTYVGSLTILFGIAVFLIVRDRDPDRVPISPGPERVGVGESIRKIISNPQFILLFFIALLAYGGMTGIFFSWGLPFLMQGYGLTRVNAALAITTTSLFSLVFAPLWGRTSDRILKRRKPVLQIGLVGVLLASGVYAFFAPALSITHILVIFAWMGSTASALILAYTMVNQLVPASIAGAAAAFLNMGPYIGRGLYDFVAGLILGPASSLAADGTPVYALEEYQAIFIPSVAAGIIALTLSFFLKDISAGSRQRVETSQDASDKSA